MSDIVGKLAYKKQGLFSGVIGVIAESNNSISPYVIKVENVTDIPFRYAHEVQLIEK